MSEMNQITHLGDAGASVPLAPTPGATPKTSRVNTISWDVLWERYGIATILLALWGIAALTIPAFGTSDNLTSLLLQSSFVGIGAIGMTMAILMGTFDLSVVSTLGLCAWIAVSIAGQHQLLLAIVVTLVVGGFVGAINGSLIAFLRFPAFIVTLSMQFLISGFHYILTTKVGNEEAHYSGHEFTSIGNGNIAGVPTPFVIFVACAIFGAWVIRYTPFGRYIFAAGSNPEAAQVAGVPVKRTLFFTFVAVGVFTALAGFLLGSRLYSAAPGLEPGYELNVIATVVLGGTRLSGGRGSMLGTFAAALFFTTINNVLNLLTYAGIIYIDPFAQRVIVGMILLLALSIEGIRARLAERLNRR